MDKTLKKIKKIALTLHTILSTAIKLLRNTWSEVWTLLTWASVFGHSLLWMLLVTPLFGIAVFMVTIKSTKLKKTKATKTVTRKQTVNRKQRVTRIHIANGDRGYIITLLCKMLKIVKSPLKDYLLMVLICLLLMSLRSGARQTMYSWFANSMGLRNNHLSVWIRLLRRLFVKGSRKVM